MKAWLVGLLLILAVVLLVIGWLVALPAVGRIVLVGAVVLGLIGILLVQLPDLRRYLRMRSM